ncbi:MAG: hypothetical protein WDN10_00130 [bacterium]
MTPACERTYGIPGVAIASPYWVLRDGNAALPAFIMETLRRVNERLEQAAALEQILTPGDEQGIRALTEKLFEAKRVWQETLEGEVLHRLSK